jgi:hypothetical protein
MPTVIDVNYFTAFTPSGSSYALGFSTPAGGNITFNEDDFADGQVDVGDTTGLGVYLGVVTLNGEDFRLFDGGGSVVGFAFVTDPGTYAPPSSFAASAIQPTSFAPVSWRGPPSRRRRVRGLWRTWRLATSC